MQRIETTILSSLIYNETYLRKVFPFLKSEYFTDPVDNKLFNSMAKFIDSYNQPPSKEAIEIALQNDKSVNEDLYEGCVEQLAELEPSITTLEWIVNESESFCKRQSVFNAVSRSIQIIDGKDKELSPDAIPSILQEALSVAFDTSIGHDYWDDMAARFDLYNQVDERVPFKIDMLNKITKGGVPKKSLTCILCQTGGGKSVFMCDWAAHLIQCGKNVLYFTAEMSEARISERIDANILDVTVDSIKHMQKSAFIDRLSNINKKTRGRLIVKEFPTASSHVGHLKAVLNELRIKKDFIPDIIFVDYINIFLSQRYKSGNNANSYTIIKSIAEELRGLSVEFNVPIVTATQVNKNGINNSDVEMTDTAESSGLLHVLDLYFALIPTEELDELNQIMCKQLKNRFGDVNYYRRFVIGKDFSKMKFYDLDNAAAGMIQDDHEKSIIEKTEKNNKIDAKNKFAGKDFEGITF